LSHYTTAVLVQQVASDDIAPVVQPGRVSELRNLDD